MSGKDRKERKRRGDEQGRVIAIGRGEPGKGRGGRIETSWESFCTAAWGDGGSVEDEIRELEVDGRGEVVVEVVVGVGLVVALAGLEIAGEGH